jgi:hypothetical protein
MPVFNAAYVGHQLTPAATTNPRLAGGCEGGLALLSGTPQPTSASLPTDAAVKCRVGDGGHAKLSHGVAKVLGPAGGSQIVACERVRAIHDCCKGDASHLSSSGLREAYPASLGQCSASSSRVLQGKASRTASIHSAPESSARPSGSVRAADHASRCSGRLALPFGLWIPICASPERHMRLKHGSKNAPAP